ncbi:hypothetical protein D3C73_1146400 [compost metagenome]
MNLGHGVQEAAFSFQSQCCCIRFSILRLKILLYQRFHDGTGCEILIRQRGNPLPAHGIGQLPQRCGHFLFIYGLQNIVVNPIAQCLLSVLEVVEAADNDECQIQSCMFLHAPDQIQTVQNRHPDICNHQVRLKLRNHVQRFRTIVRLSRNAEFERFPRN